MEFANKTVEELEARKLAIASEMDAEGADLDALTDDSVKKWAFNASFERICLSQYL